MRREAGRVGGSHGGVVSLTEDKSGVRRTKKKWLRWLC